MTIHTLTLTLIAVLAGLVLAPIVTGGALLLALVVVALAADDDYERRI